MKSSHLYASFTLILSLFIAAPLWAGEPTDFIKKRTAEVTKVLKQSESAKRASALDKVLKQTIDFKVLAKRSLKGHWEKRTPEEQAEFLGLLQKLLRANYANKLGGKKINKDYKIEYTREKKRELRAIVGTKVVVDSEAKPVEYKLLKRTDAKGKESWIVYDVNIDDISLEETYRESYTEIIREEGWPMLITRMKDRIKELEKAPKGKKAAKK